MCVWVWCVCVCVRVSMWGWGGYACVVGGGGWVGVEAPRSKRDKRERGVWTLNALCFRGWE